MLSFVSRISPFRGHRDDDEDLHGGEAEELGFEISANEYKGDLDPENPHVQIYLEMLDRGSDFEIMSAEVPRLTGGKQEDED